MWGRHCRPHVLHHTAAPYPPYASRYHTNGRPLPNVHRSDRTDRDLVIADEDHLAHSRTSHASAASSTGTPSRNSCATPSTFSPSRTFEANTRATFSLPVRRMFTANPPASQKRSF